jgi:hypothetical protein
MDLTKADIKGSQGHQLEIHQFPRHDVLMLGKWQKYHFLQWPKKNKPHLYLLMLLHELKKIGATIAKWAILVPDKN